MQMNIRNPQKNVAAMVTLVTTFSHRLRGVAAAVARERAIFNPFQSILAYQKQVAQL